MKDSYPTSSVWPYILSVLVLIGMVLAPPSEWPATVRDMYRKSAVLLEENIPVEASDDPVERIVIAFDPQAAATPTLMPQPPIESASFPPAESIPLAPKVTHRLNPTRSVGLQPSIPSVSQRRINDFPHHDWESVADAPTAHAISRTGSSHSGTPPIWLPPPGWQPRPIRPYALQRPSGDKDVSVAARRPPTRELSSGHEPDLTASTQVSRSARTDTRSIRPGDLIPSEIQPPVANQVAQSARSMNIGIRLRRTPKSQPFNTKPIGTPERLHPESQPSGPTLQPPAGVVARPTIQTFDETRGNTSPDHSTERTPKSRQDGTPIAWPDYVAMSEMLRSAREDRVLKNWAIEITKELASLSGKRVTGAVDELNSIARLRKLATMDVDRSRWPEQHRSLHDRVRHAVVRRVDVWQPLMRVASVDPASFATYRAQKELVAEAERLAEELRSDPATVAWVRYIGLPGIKLIGNSTLDKRQAAEAWLSRMQSKDLDAAQLAYLRGKQFGRLRAALRNVVAKSVHPAEVIWAIEAYEANPNREHANRLILLIQRWQSAPDRELYLPVVDAIATYYRNANFRVAISEDLINRFVPAFRQYAERVDDKILGAEVTGRSSTRSNLAVKLIPDPKGIRLGFLAAGQVQSNTSSRKGGVTMFNRGQSAFAAGKEIALRPDGVFVSPTETRAVAGNHLVGMQTDWDDVPIIGRIVRSVARQEIDEQRSQLQAEMQRRIRRQARQRIDSELEQRVEKAGKNFGSGLVDPLRRLELDPKAVEMRTTQDRVILRTRLASAWQFASHTPRPQARADSKMSVQIHQSAANNIIEQLQLQGRRMTLDEMMQTLSERLGMPLQLAKEEHGDAIIQFADHPLEFEFRDDQIKLTIHFAELKSGRRSWKNFSIRGYYRADVRQLEIELVRDGSIELIGERIGLRDQLALRSIFTKVLAKHTRLQILRNAIRQQAPLQSLTVTQFTIRDGWVALAFGEKMSDVARRSVRPSMN